MASVGQSMGSYSCEHSAPFDRTYCEYRMYPFKVSKWGKPALPGDAVLER